MCNVKNFLTFCQGFFSYSNWIQMQKLPPNCNLTKPDIRVPIFQPLQNFNLLLYYREKSEIEINNTIKEGKNIETNGRNRKKIKKIPKK